MRTNGNDSFLESFESKLRIDRELRRVFVEMGDDRLQSRMHQK